MCQRSKRTSGHELTPTNWVMGWPPNTLSKFSVCSFSDAIQWLFTLFFFLITSAKEKVVWSAAHRGALPGAQRAASAAPSSQLASYLWPPARRQPSWGPAAFFSLPHPQGDSLVQPWGEQRRKNLASEISPPPSSLRISKTNAYASDRKCRWLKRGLEVKGLGGLVPVQRNSRSPLRPWGSAVQGLIS